MSEIPKAYEPEAVENRWYAEWLSAGCFKAVADPKRQPYAIMIPPPNVTGRLHMGHVLDNTLQDIFVRRARQEGKAVFALVHGSVVVVTSKQNFEIPFKIKMHCQATIS